MPRRARQIVRGEIYHIINRGNNRQEIFRHPEDYEFYLSLLGRYSKKYSVSIFHYCLMPNHTHLLVKGESSDEGVTYSMHGLQTAYAIYYQKRWEKTGHVFENRFRSFLIDKDAYLLECGRYIERNPVRARIVDQPELYLWSSFRYYGLGITDSLITPNPLYCDMGQNEDGRRIRYAQYVKTPRAYETIVDEYFEERV